MSGIPRNNPGGSLVIYIWHIYGLFRIHTEPQLGVEIQACDSGAKLRCGGGVSKMVKNDEYYEK